MSGRSEAVVLCSGGIDSTTALALACQRGDPARALFVDYGQAASEAEERASRAIAGHHGVEHTVLRVAGKSFAAGEIPARNAVLVHLALFDVGRGSVVIGIHAGTGYRDCSPEFVELMQLSYDFHSEGRLRFGCLCGRLFGSRALEKHG
jgi:7-cyano-7-deazaguanine synthase